MKLSEILNISGVERACPACQSERAAVAIIDRNRREGLDVYGTYVHCQSCGTIYLNPIPNHETLSSVYGDALVDLSDGKTDLDTKMFPQPDSNPDSLVVRMMKRLHKRLKGRPHSEPVEPGEGRIIFDFGCLAGGKLVEYHQRGWRVAGLDLNARGINRAKQLLPEGQFICGDILNFTPQELFDVIRSDNVIEHLPNPKEVLIKLRSLLRPGGCLFLMVPNGKSLSVRLFGKYSINYWIPFHLNLFNVDSLKYLLEDSGFGDVKVRTFSPNNSLSWSLRQRIYSPGFWCREPGWGERLVLRCGLLFYPIEVLAGVAGLGEELIAEARR
jgi:SAM-dependent methyltransferase